jgi:RNA polymerase sigma factor (sigma-70 family)
MSNSPSRFDVIGQIGALRRYARSLTRDGTEAEDLVQDALLRAYERRASFRKGANLRPWLLSILHNTFIDGVRSRRSEAARRDHVAETAPQALDAPQDHAVRLTDVRRAFMALPEEQRAALHLVAIEGLSYQQAADMLAIPVGTLMSRIGRARAALRALDEPGASPSLKIVGGRDVPSA